MYGPHTTDYAIVLAAARRDELTRALRSRHGPPGTLRAAVGNRLVSAGLRLLGNPVEPPIPSTWGLGA